MGPRSPASLAPRPALASVRLALAVAALGAIVTAPPPVRASEECLGCHADERTIGAAGRPGLLVDRAEFEKSVHGASGIGCADCHSDLAGREELPHRTDLAPVDCSSCHAEASDVYAQSIHGRQARAGDASVAGCTDCHGTHGILPKSDPASTSHVLKVAKMCARCHADHRIAAEHHLNEALPGQYEKSVHGRAANGSGLISAAVCTSCHGAHDIRKGSDAKSRVYRMTIPKTCGGCHVGIYQGYVEGVHGKDYLKGIQDVPVCTDCHGEHTIGPHNDPDSSVFATRIGRVCARCHEDERLAREYGLQADRFKSFLGTYHGVASEYGDAKVANCASCHGFHDIRPANDPQSMIHPANIPRTCGKCHPNAGENFARGKVHVTNPKEHNVWQFIVQKAYTILIGVLIGGFVTFIAVDLAARVVRKRRAF